MTGNVLAAAIVGRVDVIVTLNLKDFPVAALAPYNIEAQHPDDFIVHQFGIDQGKFLSAFKGMRARYKKETMTAEEFLARLEARGLVGTATSLRPFVDVI